MYVCMYVCVYVCLYVCMCTYACWYVFMYVYMFSAKVLKLFLHSFGTCAATPAATVCIRAEGSHGRQTLSAGNKRSTVQTFSDIQLSECTCSTFYENAFHNPRISYPVKFLYHNVLQGLIYGCIINITIMPEYISDCLAMYQLRQLFGGVI